MKEYDLDEHFSWFKLLDLFHIGFKLLFFNLVLVFRFIIDIFSWIAVAIPAPAATVAPDRLLVWNWTLRYVIVFVLGAFFEQII